MGSFATNPVTNEEIPIWIADYVMVTYGTGSIMAVPFGDTRDFEFARKFNLPIRVIARGLDGTEFDSSTMTEAFSGEGVLVNSGEATGMRAGKAHIGAVIALLEAKGIAREKTTYRLRDWLISRQRYWGTPIPIIHCADCGDVPVPEKDLPVVLPQDLIPDGSGSPLKTDERFINCACPKCAKPAKRETDTMDTFVDSSWYYMRYTTPNTAPDYHDKMVSSNNDYWMPMDQYIGGITHAVLHLLYARFWTKAMRDLGLVKFDEPFTNLLCQGMVLNHIYYRKSDKGGIEYFAPDDVEPVTDAAGKPASYRSKTDGLPVVYDGVGTMSKSKLNGVDPQEMIDHYGADAARLFVMFASPPEQTIEWSSAGVEGSHRYLRRLWNFCSNINDVVRVAGPLNVSALSNDAKKLRHEIHATLKQASYDYSRLQYNTVVSACMKILNVLEENRDATSAVIREGVSILLRVLYPACPHVTWQLWNDLGLNQQWGDIIDAPWPEPDPAALEQDEIEMVVQVNGKLRGSIRAPKAATKEMIEQMAITDAGVARHTEGKPIKRLIVVPGKLVNVVV